MLYLHHILWGYTSKSYVSVSDPGAPLENGQIKVEFLLEKNVVIDIHVLRTLGSAGAEFEQASLLFV